MRVALTGASPFDFTLLVNYNLEGNKAAISLTVINEGDTDMPFSFGYHPYFMASKLENVAFDIKCATCSESAKGEQPAALSQRVVLIHELGQRRRTEELLDGCHHRADVDQSLRGDDALILAQDER